MLDATPITRELYVGSAPEPGSLGPLFDTVVLVGDYQPADWAFPGVRIRRFPFEDRERPSERDFRTALAAAEAVASDLVRGRRVLVTCVMGRNRSALVAALALHMMTGMSGKNAMALVRAKRVDPSGVRALANPAFRSFLLRLR